jgi:type II secretory pathway pseudopilin PulG
MGHRANKLQNYKITKLRNRSRGYILITLMLSVTLLALAAMAILPEIAFQIKRDREEEMIHRALAYSRAIKRYYKKFGRYPMRIEELENTNNIRFLRKRYKDPVNKDQDFKILHLSDIMLNSGPIMGQGAGQSGQGAFSPLSQGLGGGIPPQGAFNPSLPPGTGLTQLAAGGDANAGAAVSANPPDGQSSANSTVSSSSSSSSDTSSSKQQVLGGGPILGVASASKEKTIREFYDKNHYNDWLFIYDPRSDRGGMLNMPAQPNLNPGTPGQVGVLPGMVPPSGQPGGITPQSQGPPNPQSMPPEQ